MISPAKLRLKVKTRLIIKWRLNYLWDIKTTQMHKKLKELFHEVTFGDETFASPLTPWGMRTLYIAGAKKILLLVYMWSKPIPTFSNDEENYCREKTTYCIPLLNPTRSVENNDFGEPTVLIGNSERPTHILPPYPSPPDAEFKLLRTCCNAQWDVFLLWWWCQLRWK